MEVKKYWLKSLNGIKNKAYVDKKTNNTTEVDYQVSLPISKGSERYSLKSMNGIKNDTNVN